MRCHVPGRSAYPAVPCVAALLTVLAVAPPPCPCTDPPVQQDCGSVTGPLPSERLRTDSAALDGAAIAPAISRAPGGEGQFPSSHEPPRGLPAVILPLLVDEQTR